MRRREFITTSGSIRTRVVGAVLIALGIIALSMPLVAGRWSLTLLGLPLIAMGLADSYAAFMSPRGNEASAYWPGLLAFLAGNLFLLSSAFVLSGLLILLIAILTIDGLRKFIDAWRSSHSGSAPIGDQRGRRISHVRH